MSTDVVKTAEPITCKYHLGPPTEGLSPTCFNVQPLEEAVVNPEWGNTPYDYVKWFDHIWREGDPSRWGPQVFTDDAIMVDSTGYSVGGAQAASDFLLLFKYFPTLRGEVVSWSHNHTEIFINWRFVVTKDQLVPVLDKFSFIGGKVSLRQAYFDTVTFLSYLSENHGSGPLVDYFTDRFLRFESGAEAFFIPGLIWDLFKGLFYWSPVPLEPPGWVVAAPGNGCVDLHWKPVPGATSYTVKRSPILGGPYMWLAVNVKDTQYKDSSVKNGTEYYYVVSTNSEATAPPIPEPEDLPA